MGPNLHHFNRDMYPFGGFGGSMGDLGFGGGYNSFGGGFGGYGGYSSMFNGMNGYGRHDMASTLGPFSACLISRSRFDFFSFQCRYSTDNFLKLRNRVPSTLILSEFLLIVGK